MGSYVILKDIYKTMDVFYWKISAWNVLVAIKAQTDLAMEDSKTNDNHQSTQLYNGQCYLNDFFVLNCDKKDFNIKFLLN